MIERSRIIVVRCCCPGPFRAHTKWQDGAVPLPAPALTFARACVGLFCCSVVCPDVLLSVLMSSCPPPSMKAASHSVTAPVPQAFYASNLPAVLPIPSVLVPASVPVPVQWGGTIHEQQQKPLGWPGPAFHCSCSNPSCSKQEPIPQPLCRMLVPCARH